MTQEDRIDNWYGAMAYGFGWVSATYFMNATRPVIRWHALQSIVVFGGLTLSIIAADEIFPKDTENLLHFLALSSLLIVSVVLWVLLPVQTFRGKPFLVPVFAPLTTKWAGEPPWLEHHVPSADGLRVPDKPV